MRSLTLGVWCCCCINIYAGFNHLTIEPMLTVRLIVFVCVLCLCFDFSWSWVKNAYTTTDTNWFMLLILLLHQHIDNVWGNKKWKEKKQTETGKVQIQNHSNDHTHILLNLTRLSFLYHTTIFEIHPPIKCSLVQFVQYSPKHIQLLNFSISFFALYITFVFSVFFLFFFWCSHIISIFGGLVCNSCVAYEL